MAGNHRIDAETVAMSSDAVALDSETVEMRPEPPTVSKAPTRGIRGVLALATLVGAVAFAVRAFGLRTANDLFIDELTYGDLARQVSRGELPNQEGDPFFLHPPASFLLNGLVVRVGGLSGDIIDVVYQLRWVNAVLGAALVVVVFLLARRLVGPSIGVVAAVVVAFDPFVLRNDSRVMIETPATFFLLAGFLILLSGTSSAKQGRFHVRELLGGLILGLALFTKDVTFVFAIVPTLLAVPWKKTLRGQEALRVVGVALVPYAIYLVVTASLGLLGAWWRSKIEGVRRIVGLDQITGFNAPHSGHLSGRLVEELGHFGTSYVLIGLCVFAGIAASFSAVSSRRLIGLVAVCAGVGGIAAAGGGTLEEQYGYYLDVISVLALAVVVGEYAVRRRWAWRVAVVVGGAFVLATVYLGVSARLVVDDTYLQIRPQLSALPVLARVGLTNTTAEYAFLPRPGYAVWPSVESLAENHANYVMTASTPLSQGYGYSAPQLLPWLAHNAQPVLVAHGPTNGDLVIWKLDFARLKAALNSGVRIPPVTGNYP